MMSYVSERNCVSTCWACPAGNVQAREARKGTDFSDVGTGRAPQECDTQGRQARGRSNESFITSLFQILNGFCNSVVLNLMTVSSYKCGLSLEISNRKIPKNN